MGKIIFTGGQLAISILFVAVFIQLLKGEKVVWYEDNFWVALIELIFFSAVAIYTLLSFIKAIKGE